MLIGTLTCSPVTLIRWIPIQKATARNVLCMNHWRFPLHPVNGVLVDSSNVIPIKAILETIHVKIIIKMMQISLSGANVNDNIDTLITSDTDHESLWVNGSTSEMKKKFVKLCLHWKLHSAELRYAELLSFWRGFSHKIQNSNFGFIEKISWNFVYN